MTTPQGAPDPLWPPRPSEKPAPPYVYGATVGRRPRSGPGRHIAGVIVLIAVGAIVIAATHPGHTARPGASSGTTQDPDSSLPTATPLDTTDPEALTFANWVSGGGEDHLTTLSSDLKTAGTDAEALDYTALSDDCTTLQSDVESTQQYGAIPVPSIETPFAQALAYFERAAGDCLAGVSADDPTLLTKSADEMETGSTYLNKSDAAVNEYSGSG